MNGIQDSVENKLQNAPYTSSEQVFCTPKTVALRAIALVAAITAVASLSIAGCIAAGVITVTALPIVASISIAVIVSLLCTIVSGVILKMSCNSKPECPITQIQQNPKEQKGNNNSTSTDQKNNDSPVEEIDVQTSPDITEEIQSILLSIDSDKAYASVYHQRDSAKESLERTIVNYIFNNYQSINIQEVIENSLQTVNTFRTVNKELISLGEKRLSGLLFTKWKEKAVEPANLQHCAAFYTKIAKDYRGGFVFEMQTLLNNVYSNIESIQKNNKDQVTESVKKLITLLEVVEWNPNQINFFKNVLNNIDELQLPTQTPLGKTQLVYFLVKNTMQKVVNEKCFEQSLTPFIPIRHSYPNEFQIAIIRLINETMTRLESLQKDNVEDMENCAKALVLMLETDECLKVSEYNPTNTRLFKDALKSIGNLIDIDCQSQWVPSLFSKLAQSYIMSTVKRRVAQALTDTLSFNIEQFSIKDLITLLKCILKNIPETVLCDTAPNSGFENYVGFLSKAVCYIFTQIRPHLESKSVDFSHQEGREQAALLNTLIKSICDKLKIDFDFKIEMDTSSDATIAASLVSELW